MFVISFAKLLAQINKISYTEQVSVIIIIIIRAETDILIIRISVY